MPVVPGEAILHHLKVYIGTSGKHRPDRSEDASVLVFLRPFDLYGLVGDKRGEALPLLAYRTSWPKASNWADSNTVWTTIGVIAYSRQYHLKSRLSGFCCVDQFFQRIQISRAIVNE